MANIEVKGAQTGVEAGGKIIKRSEGRPIGPEGQNSRPRTELFQGKTEKRLALTVFHVPRLSYTSDNALKPSELRTLVDSSILGKATTTTDYCFSETSVC